MEEETLTSHNIHRCRYMVPELEWCDQCADAAKSWGEYLASTGQLFHGGLDGDHKMGQNLALGGKNFTVSKAVAAFMEEEKEYDFEQGGYQPGLGHFTQLVWRATTHVGAAVVQYGNRKLVVCNYHIPGNIGDFEDNVNSPFCVVDKL